MNAKAALRMGSAEWVMLVILSMLWGGSFFFGKVALAELPPLTAALLRVGLAAIALTAWTRLNRIPRGDIPLRQFVAMGLFNNAIPFVLMLWAMTRISSGLAAILNATTPFWAALLAHLATQDERITVRQSAGVLIGLLGVVAIAGQDALRGLGQDVLAQGAVVLGALSYAVAGVYGRRFAGCNPWRTAAGQLTAATALLLPLAALAEQPWTLPMPGWVTWGAIAGLALLSTALGYGLYFRILARAGATNVLLVTFLIPVSALLLGTWILRESIVPSQLGGMALILAGLAILDGRVLRAILPGRTATIRPQRGESTGWLK
jgi:drug/metabolite transporter (DMT)-like permease